MGLLLLGVTLPRQSLLHGLGLSASSRAGCFTGRPVIQVAMGLYTLGPVMPSSTGGPFAPIRYLARRYEKNCHHIAPARPCADTHILILLNPFPPRHLRRFPALVSTFLTLRTVKKSDTSPANSPSLSFTLLITPSLPTPYPVNFSDTHSFPFHSIPSNFF